MKDLEKPLSSTGVAFARAARGRVSTSFKIGELGFTILLHFLRPFIVVAKCLIVYCVHL